MVQGRTDCFWRRVMTMAVKRVTIELDDAPDITRSTALPASIVTKKIVSSKTQSTSTPEEQDDYRALESLEKERGDAQLREIIGRTPSDLVVAFINRPEFMATTLTFFAILIFAGKLHKLADFWLPGVTAVVMNTVWFGISAISRLFKGKRM